LHDVWRPENFGKAHGTYGDGVGSKQTPRQGVEADCNIKTTREKWKRQKCKNEQK
jgi:hypothetical protein